MERATFLATTFFIPPSGAQYNTMLGSEEGCVGVWVSERVNMSLNIARTQRSEQNIGSRTHEHCFKVCDKKHAEPPDTNIFG